MHTPAAEGDCPRPVLAPGIDMACLVSHPAPLSSASGVLVMLALGPAWGFSSHLEKEWGLCSVQLPSHEAHQAMDIGPLSGMLCPAPREHPESESCRPRLTAGVHADGKKPGPLSKGPHRCQQAQPSGLTPMPPGARVHGASWVLSLAQCTHFCHQGTTMTSMTLTMRAMRRRSGHISAVWLSSHPSNWTRPLR